MPPRYSIRDSITNLRSPRATWDQQFASLTSLTSGAGRPTRSAWVQTALEHDPNCVSYILNHADPRKIMVFPGKENEWALVIQALADVIAEWRKGALNLPAQQKIWEAFRTKFPSAIYSIYNHSFPLQIASAPQAQARTNLVDIIQFIVSWDRKVQDPELKQELLKNKTFDLTMLCWSLTTGKTPELSTGYEYDIFSYLMDTNSEETAITNFVKDGPRGSTTQLCRGIIARQASNSATSQAIMALTQFVTAARIELLPSNIQQEVMKATWRQLQLPEDKDTLGVIDSCLAFFLNMADYDDSQDRNGKVHLNYMMQKHGLVALIARALYECCIEATRNPNVPMPTVQKRLKSVDKLLSIIVVVVRGSQSTKYSTEPIWLKTFDLLREYQEDGHPAYAVGVEALEIWEKFGASVGLSEGHLREATITARARQNRELGEGLEEGCSWYKCVLYKQEPHTKRVMLVDRCKKRQYCSVHCQRRDWVDGGHHLVCAAN